jgi:hypothetical protein
MVGKIDLRPFLEEHIRAIGAFLISMDIKPNIDEIDFVKCATEYQILKFGRPTIRNARAKHIWLEGMNIDAIWYGISQEDNELWTQVRYLVNRHIGIEKKNREVLRVGTKIISKKKQVTDFRWQGGKLADVLNKDSSLKAPLLSHLSMLQAKKDIGKQLFHNSIEISTFRKSQYKLKQPDKQITWELIKALSNEGTVVDSEMARRIIMPIEEGVSILEPVNIADKDVVLPLLLPTKDGFVAYERIAKHIKEYPFPANPDRRGKRAVS